MMAWGRSDQCGRARFSLLLDTFNVFGTGELPKHVLGIARGIAHRLRARRLEMGTRELDTSAQHGTGLAATAGDGRHRGRSFRSRRRTGKPCTGRREAGRREGLRCGGAITWTRITGPIKPGYSAYNASSISEAWQRGRLTSPCLLESR